MSERLTDGAKRVYAILQANVAMLDDAGLFQFDYLKMFTRELLQPISSELFNVVAMQQLVLAQATDLTAGFVFMNALAFWFEVLGSTFGLLLGNALPLFVFEILYAYAVGYVLYWLVVHAAGKDYKLVAICLYVIYSLINIVAAVGSLILVVPALFFFLKTIASLSCAFYTFRIRELTSGAVPLQDEIELGEKVAE